MERDLVLAQVLRDRCACILQSHPMSPVVVVIIIIVVVNNHQIVNSKKMTK